MYRTRENAGADIRRQAGPLTGAASGTHWINRVRHAPAL